MGSGQRLHVAQAAAKLELDGNSISDALDGRLIGADAVTGAIEVDDVDPLGALRLPTPRRVDRVGVENRFALEIAFDQADRLAVPNIDGRVNNQQRSSFLTSIQA